MVASLASNPSYPKHTISRDQMMNQSSLFRNRHTQLAFAAMIIVLIITYIPWLGLTDFNTKGEPREAIVALSMIQSDNYILPVSMGVDIPYKPPFLAWLIVGASHLTNGINEFASRLPSAISAIILSIGIALFYTRRKGLFIGIATALIFSTSIEVWRAAMACRVDMTLTACMVGALLLLQLRYTQKGVSGISWGAVLLMTGAMLTKGPVGIILPCLVMMIYYLARGEQFLQAFLWLSLTAVMATIVPAIWYAAAIGQGGDTFINLVIEENFGRFLGKMSYDSHVNPWWYNFVTLAAGMLPYTLVAVIALFATRINCLAKPTLSKWRQRLAGMDKTELFNITVIAVIFIFYCIPKSKRSVYLLPIYPFVAYYICLLLKWLYYNHHRLSNIYTILITTVSIAISAATVIPVTGLLPDVSLWSRFIAIFPVSAAIATLYFIKRHDYKVVMMSIIVTTASIFWLVSGSLLPAILNQKSDRHVALTLQQLVSPGEPIYTSIDDPMLRYYTIGFYTGDRLRLFDKPTTGASATLQINAPVSTDGWLITAPQNLPKLREQHPGLTFKTAVNPGHRSCDTRDSVVIVRFYPRQPESQF